MSDLQEYLSANVGLDYCARGWDCSKLVLGWLALSAPQTAKAVVRMAVEAGYNDVKLGDEAGLAAVQAKFGSTPEDFAAHFHRKLPELVDLPIRPQPGDIAVRADGLALGVIDGDFQAVYLGRPRGYLKQALRPQDAFMRGLK